MADQGDGGPRQERAGLTGALEEMDQDAPALVDGMVDHVADVVNFTVIPDESEVLARLREFPLLDELRWATRSKKIKTFSGQVALVVNRLRVFSCDVLFLALQGTSGSGILERHRQTLQIFSLVTRMCEDHKMLGAWQYTPDQQAWLVQRLGPVVGVGRHLPITLLTDGSLLKQRGQGSSREKIEQCPFLSPLLCALISVELPLWPLAHVLASASQGWWTGNDTVFVIQHAELHPVRFGHWWMISHVELPGMC